MNSTHKALRAWLGAAVATVALATQAFAAPVTNVTVTPSAGAVALSSQFHAQVAVSTDTIIGGADFFFSFDSTLLTLVGWTIDPDNALATNPGPLCGPAPGCDLSPTYAGGNTAEITITAGDTAAALSSQPGSFTLVDLLFTASNLGTSALNFADINNSANGYYGTFSPADGTPTAWNSNSISNGSVCVYDPVNDPNQTKCGGGGGSTQVPEPGTMALVAIALGGLTLRRKQPRG